MNKRTNNCTCNSLNKMLLILMLLSSQLFAAFEIKKYTINSGGSKSTSQRFQLNGSLAQIDAAEQTSSTSFELSPGFWNQNTDLIFINNFE